MIRSTSGARNPTRPSNRAGFRQDEPPAGKQPWCGFEQASCTGFKADHTHRTDAGSIGNVPAKTSARAGDVHRRYRDSSIEMREASASLGECRFQQTIPELQPQPSGENQALPARPSPLAGSEASSEVSNSARSKALEKSDRDVSGKWDNIEDVSQRTDLKPFRYRNIKSAGNGNKDTFYEAHKAWNSRLYSDRKISKKSGKNEKWWYDHLASHDATKGSGTSFVCDYYNLYPKGRLF